MKKILICAALILNASIAPVTYTAVSANADSKQPPVIAETTADTSDAEPYLLTKISVALRADSEYVYAVAKNTFTLFISTVPVNLYLYSCDYETTDISVMTLEAEAYTKDLDVNKEITCKALHTEQKYWVAYCIYKTDNQTKTIKTSPALYSIDGKLLN